MESAPFVFDENGAETTPLIPVCVTAIRGNGLAWNLVLRLWGGGGRASFPLNDWCMSCTYWESIGAYYAPVFLLSLAVVLTAATKGALSTSPLNAGLGDRYCFSMPYHWRFFSQGRSMAYALGTGPDDESFYAVWYQFFADGGGLAFPAFFGAFFAFPLKKSPQDDFLMHRCFLVSHRIVLLEDGH